MGAESITNITSNDLLKKLEEDGAIGLDLSPGNETAKLAASRIRELETQLATAKKFKVFVHDALDKAGVPSDPDPEHTATCGCRINGRLKWCYERMGKLAAAREALAKIGALAITQTDVRSSQIYRIADSTLKGGA